MTVDYINEIRAELRHARPLIHCITNPISIHQCANAVLAAGARPIMAEHPGEVSEITQTASALMLNLGNITDVRLQSMLLAAETAKRCHIPFLLDAVGISCSQLRRNYVADLIQQFTPSVIKGNYSEICTLSDETYRASGVDASADATVEKTVQSAVKSARNYHSVVLASGKSDIITDGKTICFVQNGTPRLAEITGTGCMQGALAAAYLWVSDSVAAAVTACAVLGVCGEMAANECGSSSSFVKLMDHLSLLSDKDVTAYSKSEEKSIEEF